MTHFFVIVIMTTQNVWWKKRILRFLLFYLYILSLQSIENNKLEENYYFRYFLNNTKLNSIGTDFKYNK